MNFETSRTWANLMSAFAGESQARTRYEAYAQKAAEQGQEQIAAIFRATAANEYAHALLWLEALHGGTLPDTLRNLQYVPGVCPNRPGGGLPPSGCRL